MSLILVQQGEAQMLTAFFADAAGATAGWTDYGSWTLIPGGPKLIVVQQ